MAQYVPPLRDMHFVLHELLHVEEELKQLPAHAEVDAALAAADAAPWPEAAAAFTDVQTLGEGQWK